MMRIGRIIRLVGGDDRLPSTNYGSAGPGVVDGSVVVTRVGACSGRRESKWLCSGQQSPFRNVEWLWVVRHRV